jgi:hypothetical protein
VQPPRQPAQLIERIGELGIDLRQLRPQVTPVVVTPVVAGEPQREPDGQEVLLRTVVPGRSRARAGAVADDPA